MSRSNLFALPTTGLAVCAAPATGAALAACSVGGAELDEADVGSAESVVSSRRLSTAGGIAPATGCDTDQVGAAAEVPYTADYFFYRTKTVHPERKCPLRRLNPRATGARSRAAASAARRSTWQPLPDKKYH